MLAMFELQGLDHPVCPVAAHICLSLVGFMRLIQPHDLNQVPDFEIENIGQYIVGMDVSDL